MRRNTYLCACALVAFLAGTAAAQTRDADWKKCESQDADSRIAGCTAIIGSGHETPENLAVAYLNRGGGYVLRARFDEAIADFSQYIRMKPGDPKGYDIRGRAYKASFESEKAIADFTEALKIDPRYARAFLDRGEAYWFFGQEGEALADLNRYVEMKPDDPEGYTLRGHVFSETRQYDKAIEDYSHSIRLNPNDADTYDDRGGAYSDKGLYAQAVSDFTRFIAMKPDDADAYYRRGDAYLHNGESDKALADYDKSIGMGSADAASFRQRGFARLLTADWSGAAADLQRSLGLDSSGDDVAYRLLWEFAALSRLGRAPAPEFAKQSAALDLAQWPGPVLKFYLGQATLEQLQAAQASPNAGTQARRSCEVSFYAGERHLWRGEKADAAARLQAARDGCSRSSNEYLWAVAELRKQ